MALHFEVQENKILLFGDTFQIKEQIKLLGGRWNSQDKHWWLSHNEKNVESLKTLGFMQPNVFNNVVVADCVSVDSRFCENDNVSGSNILDFASTQSNNQEQEKTYLKVSEFVSLINSVIKGNLNKQYWISGEISSYKMANGHVFFDLIEKDNTLANGSSSLRAASISCILWAGKRKSLQSKLEEIPFSDGTQIKIKVGVDFRKEGARVVAIVEDIDTNHTKGNLLLQRLAIVQELKKRNLYNKNKLLQLKAFPTRIAMITAANSRAFSDFLDELRLSKIAFKLSVFDCNMQGDSTSSNVTSAFKYISEKCVGEFDCIVLTRGGGSRLDLRWFDDLEIAKQIAYCPLPVITAVGHFEDISIADEISFRSEKTPTAAARLLTSLVQDTFVELFTKVDNLGRILLRRFEKERQVLGILQEKIALNAKRRFQTEQKNLERMEQFLKIFSASIEKTMQRGYALIRNSDGHILTGKDFLREEFPEDLKIEFSVPGNVGYETLYVDAKVARVHNLVSNENK